MNLTKQRVVLELTIDLDATEHPNNWNWYDLLDLAPEEEVELMSINEVTEK